MKKYFIIILVCLGLLIGLFFYYQISKTQAKHFSVTFLNIGQGDAALIKFANGEKMLVDCGPNKIILSELGKNLPFWDRAIDYVLATHPDLDHYGGCVDVVRRYRVKHIITNGRAKPRDPYWREWNKAEQESGAELITLNGHQIWRMGSSALEFFSPDDALNLDAKAADNNNRSIVFKLTNENGKMFLFTGDMETLLEKALLVKYCSSKINCPLQADVLKVGHHGSDSSSGEDFLNMVKSKQAIISVGINNKFGHPALRVIRHLERAGAQILRTDLLGDIIIN